MTAWTPTVERERLVRQFEVQKNIKSTQISLLTVDGGVEQSRRTMGNKCVPSAEQYSDMMVPMKEHQFLLVCNNEKGIKQLGWFAESKKETPHASGRGSN